MHRLLGTAALLLALTTGLCWAELRTPGNARGRDANKHLSSSPPPPPAPPTIDADVVGTYTTGPGGIGGFGYELRIAASGRYAMYVSSCLPAGPPDRGRASIEANQLILTADGQEAARYTAIAWGPRRYLVHDMLAFVNDINQGDEPRDDEHGLFLLGAGEWKKPVDGVPRLPLPWAGWLLKEPITGKITAVGNDGEVTIDLGTRHGVFVGMELLLGAGWQVTVTAVRDGDCTAKTSIKVAAGDSVSSRRTKPMPAK